MKTHDLIRFADDLRDHTSLAFALLLRPNRRNWSATSTTQVEVRD